VDRVIMSHGVYSTWAPALEIFNARGIPVAVYNPGQAQEHHNDDLDDGPDGK
jgi:hypothetical protein